MTWSVSPDGPVAGSEGGDRTPAGVRGCYREWGRWRCRSATALGKGRPGSAGSKAQERTAQHPVLVCSVSRYPFVRAFTLHVVLLQSSVVLFCHDEIDGWPGSLARIGRVYGCLLSCRYEESKRFRAVSNGKRNISIIQMKIGSPEQFLYQISVIRTSYSSRRRQMKRSNCHRYALVIQCLSRTLLSKQAHKRGSKCYTMKHGLAK